MKLSINMNSKFSQSYSQNDVQYEVVLGDSNINQINQTPYWKQPVNGNAQEKDSFHQ